MIPFPSERKAMGVAVQVEEDRYGRLYVKGTSKILTNLWSSSCSLHIVLFQNGITMADEDASVEMTEIDRLVKENISKWYCWYWNPLCLAIHEAVTGLASPLKCTVDNVITACSIGLRCGIFGSISTTSHYRIQGKCFGSFTVDWHFQVSIWYIHIDVWVQPPYGHISSIPQ